MQDALEATDLPVVTSYGLFQELRKRYQSGQKLWLRNVVPEEHDMTRARLQLIDANVLTPDKDFKAGVYRIVANGDRSAEEICGIVEPFCYISHLSAMARYGLTERRSNALHLTAPDLKTVKGLWDDIFKQDYDPETLREMRASEIVKPSPRTKFPEKVRGQAVTLTRTAHPGESQKIRGSYGHIATIGQVFCDMLEDPVACGGMEHVLEVWQEHAKSYLNEIIEAIEKRPKPITKVRAGWLLDERLNLKDSRVEAWVQFAQRGSSRVLDPAAPFASTFSEKWMLSLNVP